MRCLNRILLVGAALLSTAACATSEELAAWKEHSTHFASVDHAAFSMRNRFAPPLLMAPADVELAKEQGWWGGPFEDPPVPDVAGRWTGTWSGFGVMSRRTSTAEAEFTQAGRWGWGQILLADTLAADVPFVVTHQGSRGVPVVFDVSGTGVVVKHESGGSHLTVVFAVDGNRMVGTFRGHDARIVLTRQR